MMSWSAYACAFEPVEWNRGELFLAPIDEAHPAIQDFVAAAKQVENAGHGVDFRLEAGLLCIRAAARSLARATGMEPYGGEWPPEQVKALAATADWSFEPGEFEAGSKESAKAFLTICAKHGLGMQFD
jgi:hypothetical protein